MAILDGTLGSYPFGQISDDTQCSRELAQSIIDAGRFSIEAFKEQLVHLHETLGVIGQGPTSEATLDALAATSRALALLCDQLLPGFANAFLPTEGSTAPKLLPHQVAACVRNETPYNMLKTFSRIST